MSIRIRNNKMPMMNLRLSKVQALDLYTHLVDTADQSATDDIQETVKEATSLLREFILSSRLEPVEEAKLSGGDCHE